jgi:hypothetical protein
MLHRNLNEEVVDISKAWQEISAPLQNFDGNKYQRFTFKLRCDISPEILKGESRNNHQRFASKLNCNTAPEFKRVIS